MRGFWRKLRGTIGNAVVWAASWFVAAFGLFGTLHLLGLGFPFPFWRVVPYLAFGQAMVGFVTGAVFSTYLSIAYRHRTFRELRAGRFALAGALVAAAVGPVLGALTAVGVTLPPRVMVVNGLIAATLGGLTALGTIRVAQAAPGRALENGAPAGLLEG